MPQFQIDQNNCVYLISKTKQAVSLQFALGQVANTNPPIPEDTQKIIYAPLSDDTQKLLATLS
ncbi:MAG: hypothetical protein WCJ81_08455 [bacterium]